MIVGKITSTVCYLSYLSFSSVASLPEKTEPAECSFIKSVGYLPPKVLPTVQHLHIEPLPDNVKRTLFRYDCDCVPLFGNQIGAYQACKNLIDM